MCLKALNIHNDCQVYSAAVCLSLSVFLRYVMLCFMRYVELCVINLPIYAYMSVILFLLKCIIIIN